MEKSFETGHGELEVGVLGDCKEVDEDAGNQGRESHGPLSANILDVYGPNSDDGAWYADHVGDGIVPISYVGRCVLADVLRQESIEQWVSGPVSERSPRGMF